MSNHLAKSPNTIGYGSSYDREAKIPEMPESLSDVDPTDILKAAQAIYNSPINYTLNGINGLVESGYQLKEWEIKQIEKAFSNFLTKYSSPLAKAMK